MNLIRRIGTQRHKFKLQFIMRKIKFSRNLPGKIYVSIRRGDHKMKTENLIEMNSNNECDLKKQIVTFPAITLFFDVQENKYQEKLGDMKILLINSNGDKKLLGTVPFDVAQFTNNKRDTGFSTSQAEDKLKIKKQLEEIPEKLKMEASIEFNVFVKFIGQASQTDKSIKEEKVRSQSPFDKLKTFFFGNQNEEQKEKEPQSPAKKSQSQIRNQKAQSKKELQNSRKDKKRDKSKEKSPPKFEFSDQQTTKQKQIPKRQRISSDFNQPKNLQREKASKKAILDAKLGRIQKHEQRFQVQEVETRKKKKNQPKVQQKLSPSESEYREDSGTQQKKTKVEPNRKANNKSKAQDNDNTNEKNRQRVAKNIVEPNQRDTLTEYQEKGYKKSNYNKSQKPQSLNNHQPHQEFFFDDPTTFPPNFQSSSKKEKKTSQRREQNTVTQRQKVENQLDRPQRSKKTSNRQNQQKRLKDQQQQNQQSQQVQSKNYPAPSPKRKVKENSIQINAKELQKEIEKKKKEEKNHKQANSKNTQQNQITSIPKTNERRKQAKPVVQTEQPDQSGLVQINKKQLTSKAKDLNDSQVRNLFTSFDQQPAKRQEKSFTINPKKIDDSSSIFMKEELERKSNELIEVKRKLDKFQEIQKRLKEEQSLRQAAQKTVSNLKEQNKRLEKELQQIKQENQNLRSESQNQSGIFRATTNHFLDKSQQNNLQEENKRLEREKNEVIVTLAKEKQKHAKELKVLREQLEKEKMRYKQLENLSKIDLKKLKDQNLKLNGNAQIMKDKNKEKIKENQTLLKQNKALNSEVIELKEKFGALKIKICEKLNEANENGENELMQALTQLCQDM